MKIPDRENLREKLVSAPDAPGAYIMKDAAGKVLYVGKAKSLKKRLMSYFGRDLSTKTVALMSGVFDIEYQVCQSESASLLFEAGLIHKYQPKYNVSMRDDKSFPYVKITHEEFPALCITRKKENDRARYFGPYTNVKLLKEALKVIRKSFPYRSCKEMPDEACMYYRIGLSPAPCIGKINKREYRKALRNISLILEGKTGALIKKLTKEMLLKSRAHKFEEAAKIRDRITALSAFTQTQSPAKSTDELEDLKRRLGLRKLPLRIEAFDISDIFGKEAVGSMVSFYRGLPDKNNYRRFRIKTFTGIDDYKMLREVVRRRYRRVLEERLALPDLVLIDGGRGHLDAAYAEISTLGIKVPMMSIAKEKEHIYTRKSSQPIKLNTDTPALNLIRRIRDEAHRFALKYHHLLRRKKIIGK